MVSGSPAEDAIALHLPGWTVKLFLAVVAEGLLIATSTMFAGATRHIFGMSRDNQLPFAKLWTRTTNAGSPWAAALLVAILSLVPVFVFTTNTASMVGGATAAMYVSYFLVTVVVLWSALRGWPAELAHFNLGRWNIPITLIAMLGTGATAVNLLWPRATTNPDFDQISGTVTDSAFRHIPMGWYIVGVPILAGVVYFALWQRKVQSSLEAPVSSRGRRDLVED
jgi:amino acid transporter